jgi:hypothetical protein
MTATARIGARGFAAVGSPAEVAKLWARAEQATFLTRPLFGLRFRRRLERAAFPCRDAREHAHRSAKCSLGPAKRTAWSRCGVGIEDSK